MAADIVRFVRLVGGGDEFHRLVDQGHDVGKGVAEEAGDPDRDIHPGPTKLGERDQLDPLQPPALGNPDRPDAHQVENLGDVVAVRPHRRGPPDDDPHAPRVRPVVVLLILLDQPIPRLNADPPGGLGGDGVDVDAVEVPPRGKDAGHPPGRCPAGTGGDEAAGEAAEGVGQFVGRAVESGDDFVGDEIEDLMRSQLLRRRSPIPFYRRIMASPAGPAHLGDQISQTPMDFLIQESRDVASIGRLDRLKDRIPIEGIGGTGVLSLGGVDPKHPFGDVTQLRFGQVAAQRHAKVRRKQIRVDSPFDENHLPE